MKEESGPVLMFVLFVVGLVLGCAIGVWAPRPSNLPWCPEDAVLLGGGDYEEGRYQHYYCGPAMDDYIYTVP